MYVRVKKEKRKGEKASPIKVLGRLEWYQIVEGFKIRKSDDNLILGVISY